MMKRLQIRLLTVTLAFFGFSLAEVSAQYQPGCGNPGDNDGDCESMQGENPVNVMRGGLVRKVTDLAVFGPAGFSFSRIYNSRTRDYTQRSWELGTTYTWQHNWQYEMRDSSETSFGLSALIVRYPEGREKYFFAADAAGSVYVSEANWGDRIYPTGVAGQFVMRTPTGSEYLFTKVGSGSTYQYLLNEVRNGTGWKWTLTYQAQTDGRQRLHRITNNYGRFIQLTRSAVAGTNFWKIDQIATSDGRTATFTYSTWSPTNEHVLTAVQYPDTTSASYVWSGSTSLTTGAPVLQSALDPNYKGAGARTRYVYNYGAVYGGTNIVNGTILEERNFDTGEVSVRLPQGGGYYPEVLRHGVDPVQIQFVGNNVVNNIDPEGRQTTYTYQTVGGLTNVGFLIKEQDAAGAVTTFTRDAVGHALSVLDALGNISHRSYSSANFLLSTTDQLGRVTTHTRDAANRITRTDYPDASYETFTYTGTGLLKTHRLRNGATETLTYDSLGNLVTFVDALGLTTSHTYHNTGLRATTTDPLGHTTSFTYDWKGQPLRTTHPDGTYRENTWGIHGRLLAERDELGNVTNHAYDTKNRRISTTDPIGRTTSWTYGAAGGCCGGAGAGPLSITLPGGRTTSYTYDKTGRKLSETIAPGTSSQSTRTWTYNSVGDVATMKDALNRTTSFGYNWLRRRSSVVTAEGTTFYQYDAVGNLITTTAPAGWVGVTLYATTTKTYDTMNQVLSITNGLGHTTTFEYDLAGRKVLEVSPMGRKVRFTYDALDRMLTRVKGADTASASTAAMVYDADGNLIQEWDGLNRATVHTYNSRHFRTSTKDPLNRTTTYLHDAVGRVTRVTLADGTFTQSAYDAAGQLVSNTDALGQVTTYGYTTEGRMSSLTTPRGHIRTWSYDAAGRLYRRTHPDATYEQYTYFADHQLATHRVPSGVTATYSYHALTGRLLSRTWSDSVTPDVTYSYDSTGRMGFASNGTTGTQWRYDVLGRKLNETQIITGQPNLMVTYTYDADGQLASVTYPDGHVVAYNYTPRHEISEVTAGGPPPLATYAYNLAGELSQLVRENGVITDFTYNAAGQTGSLTHRLGGSTLESMNLGFDAVGRRNSVTRNLAASEDGFTYDAAGQVTAGVHQTPTAMLTDDFNYDAAGNLLSSQRSPNAAIAYLTNNLEQYTKIGAVTTTRDTNGNLLTATPAHSKAMTMTWDAENRLLTSRRSTTPVTDPVMTLPSTLSPGARITSTYDVLHRRVQKVVHRLSSGSWVLFSTTRYTYDGWNIIHESTTQGANVTNTRYTWGRDLSGNLRGAGGVGGLLMAEEISSTGSITPHYYAADANGNITLMTTATGSTEGAWRYSSFGGPIPYSLVSSPSAFANKNPWRFSSKYLDAEVETKSGIYWYGYRHYSPQLGRWLNRDPIGERGGINLYGMVENDAVNRWDLLGLIIPTAGHYHKVTVVAKVTCESSGGGAAKCPDTVKGSGSVTAGYNGFYDEAWHTELYGPAMQAAYDDAASKVPECCVMKCNTPRITKQVVNVPDPTGGHHYPPPGSGPPPTPTWADLPQPPTNGTGGFPVQPNFPPP